MEKEGVVFVQKKASAGVSGKRGLLIQI